MTTTAELLRKWQFENNPVTKAVYRQIIGNRIDQACEVPQRSEERNR